MNGKLFGEGVWPGCDLSEEALVHSNDSKGDLG